MVVIGTGVSIGLRETDTPALSWSGLIEDGFSEGTRRGRITKEQANHWKSQLASSDIDERLSAAEFVCRKLGAPNGDLYARWIENTFNPVLPDNNALAEALRAIISAEIPICTLNYDTLLERVTNLPTINHDETSKVTGWMRGTTPGIYHLHGCWQNPPTCILGIRDYETTIGNEVRDLIQRSLTTFKRLLFIGCGETFADPNLAALIGWLRSKLASATPQHYALATSIQAETRRADPAWQGFVEPLSYGPSHEDLPRFLINLFTETLKTTKSPKRRDENSNQREAKSAAIIAEYCSYLVRDCGQMTIEGIRADMDTTQRRFNLERLFVPLKISPAPPDIPKQDPRREEKLKRWEIKHRNPAHFGKTFSKEKRIALLALPGAGKTLLLKRLAVAYADPSRRTTSNDDLPKLDVVPLLIRCREWRDHIRLPISTLLRKIGDITGQPQLEGLGDALVPLLTSGRVLLLVDGLDEIHNDADRTIFAENLEAFLREFKDIRLVVTSREAGFNLVAPCIVRFCNRWRIAPLEAESIRKLSDYWHALMSGDTSEALAESQEVADRLVRTAPLRRLAENPLLLTMLLVVKHGAGRIPPDRVSLYDRAVEVLLDTWNIKGHDPLNVKEAVPQLAFVAFKLMMQGKQTATEKELLELLNEAREQVPQIRFYAKDSPHEFLKRVELRSSLLLEAGHQIEGRATVPFYQFRHLTFQEYLAAVAAAEGHYVSYNRGDTALVPLKPFLLAQEWKEVVPMAAVLARKQGDSLIAQLVREGEIIFEKATSSRNSKILSQNEMPAPIARLFQCLSEEAEAGPETLAAALRLIAYFGETARNNNTDWTAICRGPYGDELFHQAWLQFQALSFPANTWLHLTCANIAVHQKSRAYWSTPAGILEIKQRLIDDNPENVCRGLSILNGLGISQRLERGQLPAKLPWLQASKHLFHSDTVISSLAAFTATVCFHTASRAASRVFTTSTVLNKILSLWTSAEKPFAKLASSLALAVLPGIITRHSWHPQLSAPQESYLNTQLRIAKEKRSKDIEALISITFFARSIRSDREISALIKRIGPYHYSANVLKQLTTNARKLTRTAKPKRQSRT